MDFTSQCILPLLCPFVLLFLFCQIVYLVPCRYPYSFNIAGYICYYFTILEDKHVYDGHRRNDWLHLVSLLQYKRTQPTCFIHDFVYLSRVFRCIAPDAQQKYSGTGICGFSGRIGCFLSVGIYRHILEFDFVSEKLIIYKLKIREL